MKLFDRSVDLAQFNEDSSLYSISRAWIYNKTQQEERAPSPEPPAYTQPDEVRHMGLSIYNGPDKGVFKHGSMITFLSYGCLKEPYSLEASQYEWQQMFSGKNASHFNDGL